MSTETSEPTGIWIKVGAFTAKSIRDMEVRADIEKLLKEMRRD